MSWQGAVLPVRRVAAVVAVVLSATATTFGIPGPARAAASPPAVGVGAEPQANPAVDAVVPPGDPDLPPIESADPVPPPPDLGLPPSSPAVTTATGAIIGTLVTNGSGTPVSGVCVDALSLSGSFVARATSAADGTYAIGGLNTGSFKVKANSCHNASYAVEYYDNKPGLNAGNSVAVTDGATTSAVNASLAAGGSISGTVVADGTASPLAGICVTAFIAGGDLVTSTSSAANGSYVLAGLAAGSYRVRFQDCVSPIDYAIEHFDNIPDFSLAGSVTVTAGATTAGINASLGTAGGISGTVVADGSGAPLAGICVSPVFPSGSSSQRFTTTAAGAYVMTGLVPGTYKVRFHDCVGTVDYAQEYFDNQLSMTSANNVTVTAGATTAEINASMGVAGSISGTVVADGTAAPLAGICVSAFLTNGNFVTNTSSGPSGSYVLTGLGASSYRVRFQDCVAPIDYAMEHYNNIPDFSQAAPVSVTAGATTTGINGSLGPAGHISGTVVADGSGAPLAGICVSPLFPSGSSSIRISTAADGTYVMAGLVPGTYKVRFQDCVGSIDYATEYFDNKVAVGTAGAVTVTAGVTTPGINASLGVAGALSGTVVADGTGSPLAGICASAYTTDNHVISTAVTAASGGYTIAGLAAGNHKVVFNDCVGPVDYATELYDNKPDFVTATSVLVTAGATTSGINASLGLAGSIAGTVVADGTGAPLQSICVLPFIASTGTANFRFFTAAGGTYLVTGLAPGTYKVRFQDCIGTVDYATEFYDNKPDLGSATTVSVTAGATTAGINAGLAVPRAAKPYADFDGDGDTDRSVYRSGAWFAEGQATAFIGNVTDIPVPADYDNDGDSDRAVYRDGVWYTEGQPTAFLGLGGDIPVPGDYNGDGVAERAVFRPSVGAWYVHGQAPVYFGRSGDIPVPGDYDGNGTTDIAVFRPDVGGWYINGQPTVYNGLSGDIPVPGDYDGNGRTDIAVFRPAVGGWYTSGQATVFTGLSGDVPEPGDYNGDGTFDRAIWRKAVGGWYTNGQAPVFLGLSGDIPLPLPQAIYRTFFTP